MQEQGPHLGKSLGLSAMLELRVDTNHVWQPGELGVILKHQLAAPLVKALGDSRSGEVSQKLEELGREQEKVGSLAMLLHHAHPPAELLNLTKQFAKNCWGDPGSPLPREIAILLYYLSIAVADLRCGKQFSTLGPIDLVQGLRWCGDQPWVDETTLHLLKETIEHFGRGHDAAAVPKTAMPPAND